jgi:hypothetical protein
VVGVLMPVSLWLACGINRFAYDNAGCGAGIPASRRPV